MEGTALAFVGMEVPCASCRQISRHLVRDLVTNDQVTCTFCHRTIDLSSKEWRSTINEAANLYRQILILR